MRFQIRSQILPPDGRRRPVAALLAACLVAGVSAASVSDLHRGDPAPRINLRSIDGQAIDTGDPHGQIRVVVFGQTAHDRTAVAMQRVAAALAAPDLARESIQLLLVLSSHSRVEDASALEGPGGRAPVILHDRDRAAFRAYGVVAMPSVVVVDRAGRVAHVMTSLNNRWGDIVHDAVLFAAGKIDASQLEEALHPTRGPAPTEQEIKARRLLHLADKLMRNGMTDLAASKYREALAIDPASVAVRLRLSDLLIRRGDYVEAESLLGAAVGLEPDSTEACCGLAHVLALRGGEAALRRSESLVDDVLARDASVARAHYVKGLVRQQRGDAVAAAASFRLAAELLQQELDRLDIHEGHEPEGDTSR